MGKPLMERTFATFEDACVAQEAEVVIREAERALERDPVILPDLEERKP